MLTDDGAALAAATLTAAIVKIEDGSPPATSREESVRQTMDIYRRALNVVRNAAKPPVK